jgi:hypothetical protein
VLYSSFTEATYIVMLNPVQINRERIYILHIVVFSLSLETISQQPNGEKEGGNYTY